MSTPVPPCPKSRRRLMILLGFCIWACGIAVGAGGVLLYPGVSEVEDVEPGHSRRGHGPEDIARHLRETYELTDAEMEGVRVIYEETFSELRELRRSIQPSVDEAYREHAEKMRLLLGEERYEKWHADIERKRRRVGQGRIRSMERRIRAGQSPDTPSPCAEANGDPEDTPEEEPDATDNPQETNP